MVRVLGAREEAEVSVPIAAKRRPKAPAVRAYRVIAVSMVPKDRAEATVKNSTARVVARLAQTCSPDARLVRDPEGRMLILIVPADAPRGDWRRFVEEVRRYLPRFYECRTPGDEDAVFDKAVGLAGEGVLGPDVLAHHLNETGMLQWGVMDTEAEL